MRNAMNVISWIILPEPSVYAKTEFNVKTVYEYNLTTFQAEFPLNFYSIISVYTVAFKIHFLCLSLTLICMVICVTYNIIDMVLKFCTFLSNSK